MYRTSTGRIPRLVGAWLALAALLLLLPAPGQAVTLTATDDTYIDEGRPTKNLGSKKMVRVDGLRSQSGFVQFDLSVLGSSGPDDIDTATLRLWIMKVKDAGAVDLHLVTGPWSEDTLTAGTVPVLDPAFATGVPITDADVRTYVLVDVTDQVKGWLADPSSNHGIAILPAGTRIYLGSKESNAPHRPMEIEVTHVQGAGGSSIIGSGGVSLSDAGTEFVAMFGSDLSATESDVQQTMAVEGEVKNLYVRLDSDPGAPTASYTFTVRINGGDTPVTCAIDGTDDGDFTCSDTTNTQCFGVGDLIALESTPSAAPAPAPEVIMRWTAEFDPGTCTP